MSWFTQESGNEVRARIIEYVSELRHGTLMDDREQALKRLHFLSKSNPLEITDPECGDCFSDLCYIIQTSEEYSSDAIQTALNMLLDLIGASVGNDDREPDRFQTDRRGKPFWEVNIDRFLEKEHGRVRTLVDSLNNADVNFQYYIVQILTILVLGRGNIVRGEIATINDSIEQLIGLVAHDQDLREQTMFLLKHLSSSNSPLGESIQKVMAFQGAFDKIFEISEAGAYHVGGNIVDDSLELLENLVCRNITNQTLFLEQGYLERIPRFFYSLDSIDSPLGLQMVIRIIRVLENLVRDQAGKASTKRQFAVSHGILLKALLSFAANDRFPPEFSTVDDNYAELCTLRSRALGIVSKVIDQQSSSQNILLGNTIEVQYYVDDRPQRETRKILPHLLDLGLGRFRGVSKDISDAALSVVQAYLHGNRDGQLRCVGEFPKESNYDSQEAPFGRQAAEVVGSWDRTKQIEDTKQFCRAIRMLSFMIYDNTDAKQMAVKLPLEIPSETQQIHLHAVLQDILETYTKQRLDPTGEVQIHILLFMITWFHECSEVIKSILHSVNFCELFVQIAISGSNDDVLQRGLACFIFAQILEFCRDFQPRKFGVTDSSNNYIFDVINRQIGYDSLRKSLDDVKSLLDRDEVPDPYFRKMFISVRKHLDRRIIDLFASKKPSGHGPTTPKGVSIEQYNNILKENEELRAKIDRMEGSKIDTADVEEYKKQIREKERKIEELTQQNKTLKAKLKEKPSKTSDAEPTSPSEAVDSSDKDLQISQLTEDNDNLLILLGEFTEKIDKLEKKLGERDKKTQVVEPEEKKCDVQMTKPSSLSSSGSPVEPPTQISEADMGPAVMDSAPDLS